MRRPLSDDNGPGRGPGVWIELKRKGTFAQHRRSRIVITEYFRDEEG